MTRLRRFLIPRVFITLYCYLRYRFFVSFRAEVELSPRLEVGRKTVIGSFTKIKATDGTLRIGEHVDIANGCFIAPHHKGITIGDYALIGPNTSIVGSNYRYEDIDLPFKLQGPESKHGIRIGRNVWIGAGTVVLDGADIGEGAIVSPNSVVNSTVPRNTIVQGNPARVIYKRR